MAENMLSLEGPDRFELRFDSSTCNVVHPNGARTFRGRAARSWPKLYVAVSERQAIYVGAAIRPLSARIRDGWNADGATGYHGYKWRHVLRSASLFVWYASVNGENAMRDMQTIEAEVVFAIRSAGQWPAFQTEIHFYPSDERHRQSADDIFTFIRSAP